MTIADLLAREDLRRREFPVAARGAFLSHAAVCPLPRRVADAIQSYAGDCTAGDQEMVLPEHQIQEVRELAARLLHAQPGEIALVGPTSIGLSLVANGLEFRKGENIVVHFDDYPSNVYPWMALADAGLEVRFLNTRRLGWIRPSDVLGQIDEQTRLVALASCHFLSGWRVDLDAIGRALRERNILFCVDGIQTLGAFPTTVEHVDFLAADAHKWLLGPCAAGILYVRRELQERLQPSLLGWHNVRCPNFVAQEQIAFRTDARRYEAGSHNLLGLAGLRAALELVLQTGIDAIAAELLRKRAWLVPALQSKGCTVLEADAPPANASSIVTFHRPDEDAAALHARLTDAGIVNSLRADRTGRKYIRLSPHFYNTDQELHRVIDLL